MTAKEKAEELVDRYNYNNKHYLMLDAKQCALIAVNEIIKIKLLWFQKDTKELDFWQDVKEELLKM